MSIDLGGEQIVAVVPIRSFRNGKTRLAPVLDRAEREALLRTTAGRVIDAARASLSVGTVLVVSADDEVLEWASGAAADVVALTQPASAPGLNGAIEAGRMWALADGATAMISLFADLPLLTASDIDGLIAAPEPVVLGPDRRDKGTNALLLRLAGAGAGFRFAFGEDSLSRHLAEARGRGLEAEIVHRPGLAFDLDTPGDWTDYVAARRKRDATAEPLLFPCGAGIA